MRRRIVILGGGTGGTIMANRLRRSWRADEAEITVVDRDDAHVYQPGLLFVPFGLAERMISCAHASRQLHRDVASSRRRSTASIRPRTRCTWATARSLPYDVLIVATGARLVPEETEGMTGPGWLETVFPFYTAEGATALADALERFEGGRSWSIRRHADQVPRRAARVHVPGGLVPARARDSRPHGPRVRHVPRRRVHQAPASRMLSGLLASKRVQVVTEFNAGEVDGGPACSAATTSGSSHSTCS